MKKNLYNTLRSIPLAVCLIVSLSACSSGLNSSYPKTKEEIDEERVGKLTGDGGITLFGGDSTFFNSSPKSSINVDSYLWRASLDIVHKLPVTTADPFGGTIMTDWYKINTNDKIRYKLNIFILGNELRADGVQVTVFKQAFKNGNWADVNANDLMDEQLEDAIIKRAREIKFSEI